MPPGLFANCQSCNKKNMAFSRDGWELIWTVCSIWCIWSWLNFVTRYQIIIKFPRCEHFDLPYFSDHKAHLKSFNFLKNRQCSLKCGAPNVWINSGCAFWPKTDSMWYTALKNLSKCFRTALVSFGAALLDGLSIKATVVTSLAE